MNFLISGGSGSFGQAYVKHLLENSPAERIVIYSRDEWKQAQMRQVFNDDPRLRFMIGDVRDRDRLTRAMLGIDIVIHAAALKRIEVGFYSPEEMIRTNVDGAINVINAAFIAKVHSVVALSTDKAYKAVSPYGFSKAVSEQLFLNANNTFGEHGPRFSCVRYGNIFRSRGSLVPKWEEIIAKGAKRVPVTDPDCSRFFMRMEEAVELVSNAAGKRDLIIAKSLPAFRVGDLAEAMSVEMDIRGLPEWEKMHECLAEGICSNTARRMTVDELREELKNV